MRHGEHLYLGSIWTNPDALQIQGGLNLVAAAAGGHDLHAPPEPAQVQVALI